MGEIAFFSNKNSERKKKKEKEEREEMDNGKSAIVEIRAESFEDRLERPFKDAFSEKAP